MPICHCVLLCVTVYYCVLTFGARLHQNQPHTRQDQRMPSTGTRENTEQGECTHTRANALRRSPPRTIFILTRHTRALVQRRPPGLHTNSNHSPASVCPPCAVAAAAATPAHTASSSGAGLFCHMSGDSSSSVVIPPEPARAAAAPPVLPPAAPTTVGVLGGGRSRGVAPLPPGFLQPAGLI